MSQDLKREQFEAFFADSRRSRGVAKRPTFERRPDDTYADDHTQRHWWTWQQALRAPAALPKPADICHNCDTAAPGCGGLFADDGKSCRFHGA